jgi:hypothetical protein
MSVLVKTEVRQPLPTRETVSMLARDGHCCLHARQTRSRLEVKSALREGRVGRGRGVVARPYRAADDATKRVPCRSIKPVPKLVKAIFRQLPRRAVVEPGDEKDGGKGKDLRGERERGRVQKRAQCV